MLKNKTVIITAIADMIRQLQTVILDVAVDNHSTITNGIDSVIKSLENIKAEVNKNVAVASSIPITGTAAIVVGIKDAISKGNSLFVKYSSPTGVVTERIVDPISYDGDGLLAVDVAKEDYRRFKITGIQLIKLTNQKQTSVLHDA